MKKRRWIKFWAVAVALALAAMGCWFCRGCPTDRMFGSGLGDIYARQLAWNAVGLGLFLVAWAMRWRWWRKLAPWIFVVWAMLALYAFFISRPLPGTHRWIDLGVVRVNLRTLFVFAGALFAAWLGSKKPVRPWMVMGVVCVFFAYCGFRVLSDETRLMRLLPFTVHGALSGGAWVHAQLKAAFGVADWFGNAGYSCRLIPNPLNDAMPATAALVFGKWFPIAVFAFFAALGGILSAIGFRVKEVSGRMFVFFWGVGMVVPAVYLFLQCVLLLPVFGCSPVLAGYGATGILVFWTGLGIVFSILRETDAAEDANAGGMAHFVIWACLLAVFCHGVVSVSGAGGKFREPEPRRSDFGEFGTQARRGEILARDGSVLARAVKTPRVPAGAAGEPEFEQTREYPLGGNAVHAVMDIERTFDKALAGRDGSYDDDMKLSEKLVRGRPTDGGKVESTVDPQLQVALAEALGAAALTNGAASAWGVVLKVPSGEIAAMASYPAFNPLSPAEGERRSSANGGVETLFEPGGLMAPIAYAMGLELGLVTPETKPAGAGQLGAMLWSDRFERDLPRFGFARRVGGGTVSGEAAGSVPRLRVQSAAAGERLGEGHDLAVTALQLVNAYGVFANDGVEVCPHLVNRVVDVGGKAVFRFLPAAGTNRVLSVATARQVTATMARDWAAAAAGTDFGEVRLAGTLARSALVGQSAAPTPEAVFTAVALWPAERPEYVAAVGLVKPQGGDKVTLPLPVLAATVKATAEGVTPR